MLCKASALNKAKERVPGNFIVGNSTAAMTANKEVFRLLSLVKIACVQLGNY